MKFTTFGEMHESTPIGQSLPRVDEQRAITDLERSLAALKNKYAELERENVLQQQSVEADKEEMSEEVKNFRSTLSRQSKISQVIHDEKENLERRATDYLKINRHFEDQLGDLKTENRALNEKLEFELTRNKSMIAENTDLKSQVQTYEAKILLLENTLKTMQTDVITSESSQREKERQLREVQSALKNLTDSNANAHIQKIELENYNRVAATELKVLQDKKTELTAKINIASDRLTVLRSNTTVANAENEQMINRLQETSETLNLHIENESLLQTEKKNLMSKMQLLCEEEGRLLEDIKEIQEKIRHLESENDKIIEQLSKVNDIRSHK